jgi:hypothetical protein
MATTTIAVATVEEPNCALAILAGRKAAPSAQTPDATERSTMAPSLGSGPDDVTIQVGSNRFVG